jgi:pteridine reductase
MLVHYHASTIEAEQTASEIAEVGVEVESFEADLRDLSEMDGLIGQVKNRFGRLDVLVNSAAIMRAAKLEDLTPEDWDRTMRLNLRAPFFLIQKSARIMRQRDGGCVINISDIAGLRPWARFPAHSISKAGVEMLTRVAALALGPTIRVNAVAPGPVLKPDSMSDQRWEQIGAALPLGSAGSTESVVNAVLFLVQNPWITGETLVVDGGSQLV